MSLGIFCNSPYLGVKFMDENILSVKLIKESALNLCEKVSH